MIRRGESPDGKDIRKDILTERNPEGEEILKEKGDGEHEAADDDVLLYDRLCASVSPGALFAVTPHRSG
jgi:hypothetical protein